MDNSGPFAWGIGGKKYRLFGTDYTSGYWVRLHTANKTEAPTFMENTIAEFKALTGNNLRFIRADSDSIFDTSQEMKDLYIQAKIKPTFSSPYDQSQNSVAENGIKKLNRDVRTVMKASGAPAHLWPEADDYCIHMHNHLPTQKGTKGPVSRYSIMRGGTYAHDMELFMPFGCKAIVMTPVKARGGHKTHTQEVGWAGMFVGYGDINGHGGAYRIYNPSTRKVTNVSYNFVTCVEDSFPFRHSTDKDEPLWFEPTLESFADETEWERFQLSPEEEEEAIELLSSSDPERWNSMFDTEPILATRNLPTTTNERPHSEPPRLQPIAPITHHEDTSTMATPRLESMSPPLNRTLPTDRQTEPGAERERRRDR